MTHEAIYGQPVPLPGNQEKRSPFQFSHNVIGGSLGLHVGLVNVRHYH